MRCRCAAMQLGGRHLGRRAVTFFPYFFYFTFWIDAFAVQMGCALLLRRYAHTVRKKRAGGTGSSNHIGSHHRQTAGFCTFFSNREGGGPGGEGQRYQIPTRPPAAANEPVVAEIGGARMLPDEANGRTGGPNGEYQSHPSGSVSVPYTC